MYPLGSCVIPVMIPLKVPFGKGISIGFISCEWSGQELANKREKEIENCVRTFFMKRDCGGMVDKR
jgi:hypothetical protein